MWAAVTSGSTGSLTTATFDNVAFNFAATPAPIVTSVSATTGNVGSQVVITGTGFGTSQNGSVVVLNAAPVTINSWNDTWIGITLPATATTGPLVVTVAPNMNDRHSD